MMTRQFSLESVTTRLIFLIAVLAFCCWMSLVIIGNFITATLVDDRAGLDHLDKSALEATLTRYPNSPRLNARLARVEMFNVNSDDRQVATYAQRAVNLSPFNYEYRLLLASAQELNGEQAAAELTLRKAVELAPNNSDTHWQLANVLLWQGKLAESLPEFKQAASVNRAYLAATFDLIWRVSQGNAQAVEAATNNDARAKLALATFLIKQNRPAEAAKIFNSVEKQARLNTVEAAGVINSLIETGQMAVARELWLGLVSGSATEFAPLVWNGGFEDDPVKEYAQFDWRLTRSDYVHFSLDTSITHSGAHSIKIEFTGKDTTRLDGELRQTIVLKPGSKYRLEFYIKTDKFTAFSTPGDLHIVLQEMKTGKEAVISEPIQAGTDDWQRVSLDFTAPESSAGGLVLKLRRTPEFSYDEPVKGAIWLDDFSIKSI